MSPRRRTTRMVGAAVAVVVIALAAAYAFSSLRPQPVEIPTTRVQRGTVQTDVYAIGEIRTPHSAMVLAPPVSGTLQIVRLASTGTMVKAGDVILEFDPSEQEYNLEQSESRLAEAEQQIIKAKADWTVQASQDKVALLKARFAVRRAELDVQRNELLGEIDAKKNILALEAARRSLEQLEKDVKSRELSNKAALAVLEEQRNASRLSMLQAKQSIVDMNVKAPISGLVSLKENRDAMGGMYFPGMTLPEYREGDLVWPGRFIMEVVDVAQLEVAAKVNENDRTNMAPGEFTEIQVPTIPEKKYTGKVKAISGSASRRFWGSDPTPRFDATFEFSQPDARLLLGTNAEVMVRGNALADKLYLPRQCVFEKSGKTIVYLRNGMGFEPREVKVGTRTETQVVVEGVDEGAEVSLLDPTLGTAKKADATRGPVGGGAK